jgi:hypothetical protein
MAIRDDLQDASLKLENRELLSILSAGTRSLNALTPNLIPCDARLQHIVRGVRLSLNIRLARMALQETRRSRPTLPVLRRKFLQLLAAAPELQKYDRRPLSDSEVTQIIKTALKVDPGICHTPLLRQLRANGNACEQSRFRSLFQTAQRS